MKMRPDRPWVPLSIIVLASFVVRVAAFAYWGTGAIESEGAEYATLAENLRSGIGFVGLVTPGAQLNFNPLFPLLIAGTSFLTHNFESAARLVVLAMGTLLPLPVFGIASRLFNCQVGYIAAALAVLHPLLIHLSFTTFSEGPYATLFLTAVYVVLVALPQTSIRPWLLVGAAFGLAWLIRAEASAAFGLALLFALVATEGNFTIRAKRALAAIAVFFVLVLPEGFFIHKYTGKFRLEVKSSIFFYTGKRILAAERNPGVDYETPGGHHEIPSAAPDDGVGQSWEYKWAFYGVDSNLKGMGFPLRRHTDVIKETQITLKDKIRLLVKGVRLNAPELLRALSTDWFGAPILPALALLGVLRRPWRGPHMSGRFFVLLIAAAPVFATFFALWSEARYYFLLVPLLTIWAANGLYEVGLWLKATCTASGWSFLARPALSQYIVPGLICIVMLVGSVKGVRRLYLFTASARPTQVEKEVGLWIGRQQNHRSRIMDISLPLAFHADAQFFSYFPYCSGDDALRFIDLAKVDYVILRRGEHFTKYYDDWVTNGIPDQRAELLAPSSVPGDGTFVLYRWHSTESGDGR